MTTIQVCRTCLAHDTRMYTIANTPLQEFYEKITDLPANTHDGRPLVMCYICYHLLKKCHRFTAGAIKANEVLLQVRNGNGMITEKYFTMIDKRLFLTFSKLPVTHLNVSSGVLESIEIPSRVDFEVKTKKELDDLAVNATVLSEDIYQRDEMEYEIKKEIIEVDEPKYQTRYSSDSDDGVPLKRTCNETDDLSVKRQSDQEDNVQENKGGPNKRKQEHSTNPEGLEIKSSSRKETKKNGVNHLGLLACSNCGELFPSEQSLKRHLTQYKNVKTFSCNSCDYKSTKKKYFVRHVRNRHIRCKVTCDICYKTFTGKYSLITHLKTHTVEKPFKCDHCGKRFRNKLCFTHHTFLHTAEKTFSCNCCKKKFIDERKLEIHLKNHARDLPFSCSYCERKFKFKSRFDSHLRTHTGEKPYECNNCGRKFASKRNVKFHLKICK